MVEENRTKNMNNQEVNIASGHTLKCRLYTISNEGQTASSVYDLGFVISYFWFFPSDFSIKMLRI